MGEVEKMKISDILRHKGATVATIEPGSSVTDLLATLAEHNIGALVVADSGIVIGIASERDIVRRLHTAGTSMLSATVGEIMSSPVVSCQSSDDVDTIAAEMTERRIRHMPVIDGGSLVGIVSIGDVVLSRMRQLEHDRGHLEHYISG
jgi:CBS domain-containing protein